MRRTHVGVGALTVAALLLAILVAPSGAEDARARYAALEELPTTAASVEGIDEVAVELADDLDAVLVDDPVRKCEPERLRVVWEEPEGHERGTVFRPVGPPPGAGTEQVNGAVICEGSSYQYMGFRAHREGDVWRLAGAPVFDTDVEPQHERPAGADRDLAVDLAQQLAGDLDLSELGPVDPYAPYEPQRLCDPTPKPATVAFANLLLDSYHTTSNWGISRDCDIGGVSEHKEGRAFDWGASVDDPHEKAAVEHLLLRLLATDSAGNEHALARRMGVMYIIWDQQIWSSFRAEDGWRPYGGPSAHRDHVHISLSWDGAMGQTSLWELADIGPHLWRRLVADPNGTLPGPSVLVAEDPFAGGPPDLDVIYEPPRDEGSRDEGGEPGAEGGEGEPSDDPSGNEPDGPLPTELPTDELTDLPTELPTDELTELPDLPTELETPTLDPDDPVDPTDLTSPTDELDPSELLSPSPDDTTDELLDP